MAFNPVNFKLPPVRLYAASWGPGLWITHQYIDRRDVPSCYSVLIFKGSDRKTVMKDGLAQTYAYHMHHGTKHGVEYLTRINPDGSYQKANLWTTRSMAKVFAQLALKDKAKDYTPIYIDEEYKEQVNTTACRLIVGHDEEGGELTLDILVEFNNNPDDLDPEDSTISYTYRIMWDGETRLDYYDNNDYTPETQRFFIEELRQIVADPWKFI